MNVIFDKLGFKNAALLFPIRYARHTFKDKKSPRT